MRNAITGGRFPPGVGLSDAHRLNRMSELFSKAVRVDWMERIAREEHTRPAAISAAKASPNPHEAV